MTKKDVVSTPDIEPVLAHAVVGGKAGRKAARGGEGAARETREQRAAAALGVTLGELVREHPLWTTWRARRKASPGGAPELALVLLRETATPAQRERFAHTAEDVHAAGDALAGVLRLHAVAPQRDAYLADLWTTGTARDQAALGWALRRRVELVRGVVRALEGVHTLALTHGCLCPDNVLLDDDLAPVLSEVGSVQVRALDPGSAEARHYLEFAAPEVKEGGAPDARSDVYSAGRLLEGVLHEDDDVPAALTDIVRRCTADDPAERFADAAALGSALDAIVGLLPATAAEPAQPPGEAREGGEARPAARPRPAAARTDTAPRAFAPVPPGREAPQEPWRAPVALGVAGAVLAVAAVGAAAFVGGVNDALRPVLSACLLAGAALATTLAPPMPRRALVARAALAAGVVALLVVLDPLSLAYRLAAQRHVRGDETARRQAVEEVLRLGRDFRGLSLAGVDLSRLDLTGADLRGVSLAGANLARSRLYAAEVQGASFDGANLAGADLEQVELSLATTTAAACDDETRLPSPWRCNQGRLTRGSQ